jgi:hypothetical protein
MKIKVIKKDAQVAKPVVVKKVERKSLAQIDAEILAGLTVEIKKQKSNDAELRKMWFGK